MPLVHECAAPDCCVLTMGVYCLEHEAAENVEAKPASLIDALAVTPAGTRTDAVGADPRR